MNDITKGLIRHTLTIVGGALVSRGLISTEELSTVVGSILTITGTLWSIFEKRKQSNP